MITKKNIKGFIKRVVYSTPIIKNYAHGIILYRRFSRTGQTKSRIQFLQEYGSQLYLERHCRSKALQIARLLRKIEICPVDSNNFFYSIDCMKALHNISTVFGNCTADYDTVVHSSFRAISDLLEKENTEFAKEECTVISALYNYVKRCRHTPEVAKKYACQLDAIESTFQRPAESFFEALQRILFFNQFLWQTGHSLNGLGHLDWILEDLYLQDIEKGILTRESAEEMIKEFLRVLHENYWYKSAVMLGDTGQIIILGGRGSDGEYHCNCLTYLFIMAAKELHLPDPKVLLRCTADMPRDLLELAVDCISTGLGAPLLSNDETVIPSMLSCGFDETDVYRYGVSACWEPLIPGLSFEPNNIYSLNFAVPFTRMAASSEFDQVNSLDKLISMYEVYLGDYIAELLKPLVSKIYEKDPLLSLLSLSCLKRGKDITRGGAKYSNMGLTSVGLGTVVNSFLNLERLVFSNSWYSIKELNSLRKKNFEGMDDLIDELKSLYPNFGSDDKIVIGLSNRLVAYTSREFKRYETPFGGLFKFGLSSPNYISGADQVPATFDGRRYGEPFSVHISSTSAIPHTELLSFAMQMDYRENRLNGNVIDFITSPGMLRKNRDKYVALLFAGFAGGIFELQMNVVDSKTLIAAKQNPNMFPDLIVRVWGFSAYFNDLPEEYKDVLIARALKSETVS